MTQSTPSNPVPAGPAGTRKRINRRKFLLLAGGAAGAACLTCVGVPLALTASQPPAPDFEFVEDTYGETSMPNDKILVAYASRNGSTAGVAESISQQLAAGGAAVELRQIKDVTDLSGYRAVVLGSAVQSGAWLPEAVEFVQNNQAALRAIPTAYFLVCMMAVKTDEQSRNFVAAYLEPVRQLVKPVAEGRFTGALFPSKYSFFEGLGLRIFLAYLKLKPGDYRDFDAVRAWAGTLPPLLSK